MIDVEGKILVATFPDAEQFVTPAQTFVESPADSQVVNGCQFFKVFDDHQLEYILLAYGDSEDVYMIGKIAAFQIQNLLVAYKERFDKDNFIKNLILDNLLLVEYTIVPRNFILKQKYAVWYSWWRQTVRKMEMSWRRSGDFLVGNQRISSQR